MACIALTTMACEGEPSAGDPVVLPAVDAMPDLDPPDDAGAEPDMQPDAAPDAAPGCEPDCPLIEWAEGPSLGRASDHHTTAVLAGADGAALYVLGGISTDARGGIAAMSDRIQRATIDADGMPAAFTDHGALPFPLAFHGQAIGPDVLHLTAGVRMGIGGPAGSAAIVAVPYAGAALGEPVLCDEALPEGVVHPTAERIGDRLYVIGGTRQNPVDGVWTAEIGPDGCPLPFAAAAALPEPRSHHASAVVDGRILVLGGFGPGQFPRTDILASVHDADGAVVDWEAVGTLDPAPWTASAVVDGDWLWLIGGGEGSGFAADFVDTVRRAPLLDGLPGAFEAVQAPLPIARSHVHQTPLFDGRIYSVAGRIFMDDGITMTSTDRTFVGELRER